MPIGVRTFDSEPLGADEPPAGVVEVEAVVVAGVGEVVAAPVEVVDVEVLGAGEDVEAVVVVEVLVEFGDAIADDPVVV